MSDQKHHARISRSPDVTSGKPVIASTRLPVAHVLRKLAEGMTPDEIIADHPHLTLADIRAAQAYGAAAD